jgi:rod shape determining protein RodA
MIAFRKFALSTYAIPGRRLRAFDWTLFAAVLTAIAFGTAMIYSATLQSPVPNAWDDLVVKQLVFTLLGLGVMFALSVTEYRVLLTFWKWIYVGTILALFILRFLGRTAHGSQRWFTTGIADVQPSEFAKVALIIVLAAYFERYDVRNAKYLIGSLALIAVPVVMAAQQPNLSSALILTAIWLAIAIAAGLRALHFSILALLGTPALAFAIRSGLLEEYQLRRISLWLNPAAEPLHGGFQHIQTLIAVGNGGLRGTGFAGGPQTQGGWLPLLYTDNIYALIAEELGFLGGVAVLALLTAVVWRILRTSARAQEKSGALIAVGVAAYLVVQAAVNIGVVLQLLPVTGVSLPFISYGGSSLVALFAAIGLVQSVNLRRKSLEFT